MNINNILNILLHRRYCYKCGTKMKRIKDSKARVRDGCVTYAPSYVCPNCECILYTMK